MKKYFLLLCLMGAMASAEAQTKIGVKISPSLSFNRLSTEADNLSVSPDGVGLKVSFGPIVDFFIKENYYFSTGILYAPKRAALSIKQGTEPKEDANFKLQYLQIPATIKAFTNELALDTRLYFQFGVLPEIKIHEEDTDDTTPITKFRTFDFSVLAGFGLEYRLGVSSTIFGGISYTRGLVNAAADTYEGRDFILKNDLVSLDLGMKF